MKEITERILHFNQANDPGLRKLKYRCMTQNAFRFFRATCHIFYEDLSTAALLPESPVTWLSGDLHLENFGSYKGDNSLVYFDMNDFDEAVLSPVLLDIVRIVTSIYLAFDSYEITDEETEKAIAIFLKYFSETLSEGSARYIEPQTATGIVKKFLTIVSDRKQKELLKEKTVGKGKKIRLYKGDKKQLKVNALLKTELIANFNLWMKSNPTPPNNYEVVDVSFRIAGTGSIGVNRFLFLIRKENDPGKYRFIDMKQALPSSLMPYIHTPQPQWKSEAERVVSVQKRMQNIPPAQLSVNYFNGESFIMQEMQPSKDRINFELIDHNFSKICCVIQDMGVITASSYLSSSGRQGSAIADDLIAFGQNKEWYGSIIEYSKNYLLKVKQDYEDFKTDFENGLLENENKLKK